MGSSEQAQEDFVLTIDLRGERLTADSRSVWPQLTPSSACEESEAKFSYMTLDQVTRENFAQCLGQSFQIECDGRAVDAELSAVTGLGFKSADDSEHGKRESFTLLFHAPKNWRLPQRIYQLSHPKLGALEMFLVPIGPDQKGMRLEAVFNFT